MNIVITGSLGNISKPLAEEINQGKTFAYHRNQQTGAAQGHCSIGANAAIGTIQDLDFMTATFKEADMVYLMEAWEGTGNIFD